MMKITEKEFNVETGEETITEREETKSEKELRLLLEAESAILETEAKAKAIAKAELVVKLGITAEEAVLLLG
jgi:hypothetical protein